MGVKGVGSSRVGGGGGQGVVGLGVMGSQGGGGQGVGSGRVGGCGVKGAPTPTTSPTAHTALLPSSTRPLSLDPTTLDGLLLIQKK